MKVLMICLGNICRSPTAEVVLRVLAERESPGLFSLIDSAGTADYHLGEQPDARSVAAAARRGYDLSALRARQLVRDDFENFDLILAMDRSNLAAMRALAPAAATDKLQLFLHYAPTAGLTEMPDPYYGQPSDFDRVIDLCELAAQGLIKRFSSQRR